MMIYDWINDNSFWDSIRSANKLFKISKKKTIKLGVSSNLSSKDFTQAAYFMKEQELKLMRTIDNIEGIRAQNNVLWMDIVRIALKHAPADTRKVMKKINENDKKISMLWGKIANG